ESALDVLGRAEAVLLAREEEVSDRHTPLTELLHHRLGLAWRHDPVLFALEEDYRNRQAIRVKNRRTFAVQILALGIRTHQRIQVARFELVRVARQRRQIA